MDDVLFLLAETYIKDDYGVSRPGEPERRQVFCRVRSVTRQEFFEAGRNGLNPSQEFLIFGGDYQGERSLEWRGERFAVYRTYQAPGTDYLELYAQREGGTNGDNAP